MNDVMNDIYIYIYIYICMYVCVRKKYSISIQDEDSFELLFKVCSSRGWYFTIFTIFVEKIFHKRKMTTICPEET